MKLTPLCLVAVAGCYNLSPMKPVAVPPLPPDTLIEVTGRMERVSGTQEVEVGRTCGERYKYTVSQSDCAVHTAQQAYEADVEVVTIQTSIGKQPLTYGELQAIAAPDYEQKIRAFNSYASTCRRARITAIVGVSLAVIGGVTLGVSSKAESESTTGKYVGLGMLGVGAPLLGLGAYWAFPACGKGLEIREKYDFAANATLREVVDRRAEVEEVARRFNDAQLARGVRPR